ncbi:MAG TPA: L,D-transpeptidase family protein [Firmicutes bacterium]|nr:L,D-transpeptidase family protein [Bacillota bacterium]
MFYASRFLRTTRPAMVGPDVYWVKTVLAELGFLSSEAAQSWEFDTQTEAAVLRFQRIHGLPVDGIVGPTTFRTLWTLGGQKALFGANSESPITGSKYPTVLLHIDGGRCLLHHFAENRLLRSYPVALGSPNTPTPNGYWHIISREVNPGGFFGSRWLGLSIPFGAYGIHGTDNPQAIGKRATHGCVYMLNSHIEELFAQVQPGTPVLVTGPAAAGRMLEVGVLPGRDIQRVQTILQTLQIFSGRPDGRYTPATAAAVASFQKMEGLHISGKVCPYTYEALEKSYDIAVGAVRP